MTRALQLMMALAVACAALRGQDTSEARAERQGLLMGNLEQLKTVVAMDRTTPFFPGEAATVTVMMSNPTPAPIEVIDRRAPKMASFAFSAQGGVGMKDKSEWPEFGPPKPLLSDLDPTTVMQPGQTITMTFPPDRCERPYPTFANVPTIPGNYRLRFRLGGEVEFQVGAPALETWAVVPLQEFTTFQEEGMKAPETVQKAAMIVAVSLNGEHVIMAAQHNASASRKILELDKEENRWIHGGEHWVRLATLTSKVTRLSGTADPSGQITVEYATEDGGGRKLYLDKNRHPS